MKVLKWILGVLVVLVLLFFSIGMIKSEVIYDCEIMIDKPVAEAWAVAQDPDKMSEWLVGFKRMEHVSGTPGTVGAVSDVYFDNGGTEMTIRETIKEIGPGETIVMLFENELMDMDYTMKMTGEGAQTKLFTSTTTRGNSAAFRSIMAISSSAIKAQEDANLELLKKAIESNTKNYFPKPTVEIEQE